MLLLLSPSKNIHAEPKVPAESFTTPVLMKETEELMAGLKKLSRKDLSELMHISEKLSDLNFERNQNFKTPFTEKNATPSLFLFKGDVYANMDIENYNHDDITFAQNHLRILSGLYGSLRPLDLIQPYRLEMGCRFKNSRSNDLYGFWGGRISDEINQSAQGEEIINLASKEYFSAIDPKKLKSKLITISLKQEKNGQVKTIGLMAKRARGMMADFVIKNKLTDVASLKDFSEGGYKYQPNLSNEDELVFISKM
jgi:cytoplasmic iron level regulating protein YaaA (DUF328/UPF0246 family)